MEAITYVVITLGIVVFFKRIVMILSLIPIKVWLKADKAKDLNRKRIYVPKEKKLNGSPQPLQKPNLKKKIIRLISGYIRYSIIQVGMIPSHKIRDFLYKNIFLVKMGERSIIYYGAEIRSSYKLEIGEGTIIGDQSIMDARNGIKIGKNVNFSTGVWLWSEQHDYNCPYFSCTNQGEQITIHDRAWIGPRVIILPGVTIGEGAVVAAGAVVAKDVEPFTLVGGIPAKKIGERNKDLKYEFSGTYSPFY